MKLPRVNKKIDYVSFQGGVDMVTPAIEKSPGTLIRSLNYWHDIHVGYESIPGYERFDGQPRPSRASYALLYVDSTASINDGDTLTGATSGATGLVIETADTYAVITKITGTFQAEVINVSGSPVANSSKTQQHEAATISKTHAQYLNLAADQYRSDIDAVPGSGDILGVYKYKDILYAFRNNSGRTGVGMYKSSPAGWTEVSLGYELEFTLGGAVGGAASEPSEGDSLYGGTSGATATLTRLVIESGTFAAGTAAGRLIFASQSGTFEAETIMFGAGKSLGTIAGDSDAITLSVVDGRFEFIETSFTGDADDVRLYGVDGKNRGWEFDGEVFVPINTGMDNDAPEHVYAHAYHLCYAFIGSFQHSEPGDPYQWTPLTGAGEIGLGDRIVGFQVQPGTQSSGALAIYSRNETAILYGTGFSDWQLVKLHTDTGAKEGSIQQFGKTLVLDDVGITTLSTTQAYGNFASASISTRVQPIFETKKGLRVSSCVARKRNQYRLYFSDGTGLYCTISNDKIKGIMPVQFPDPVRCVYSGETDSGEEEIYFGSKDGYVYQMDRGTSFDGDEILSYFDQSFHNMGNPYLLKKFRRAVLEMSCTGYAEFSFDYELGDGSLDTVQPTAVTQPSNVTSNVGLSPDLWDDGSWDDGVWDGYAMTDEAGWDEETYWESFSWDGFYLEPGSQDIMGNATSISLRIKSSSDYFNPIKFTGCVFEYTPTRLKR